MRRLPRAKGTSSQAAATAPAGGEWHAELADSLDRFVAELPAHLSGPISALYDELCALFLHVAVTAVEETLGKDPNAAPLAKASVVHAESWSVLMDLLRAHPITWLDTEAASLRQLARCEFSLETLRTLQRWGRSLATRAQRGIDGPVRELGGSYETLLGLRLERLTRPARRLRKTRAWLEPGAVLEWTPKTRAKSLKQLLSLGKQGADALRAPLARATTHQHVERALVDLLDSRCPSRSAGCYVIQPSSYRRSRGAHYTPWPLCVELVRRTLDPIIARLPEPRTRSLLELRICDPAMGAGAFLIAAAEHLSAALAAARGEDPLAPPSQSPASAQARRDVTSKILFGVDKDPIAVCLARLTLSWFGVGSAHFSPELQRNLRQGDALIGCTETGTVPTDIPHGTSPSDVLHWPAAFPSVFEREGIGFDAVLGNPPWVAYVGRAAQPLSKPVADYYAATNPAFRRYRTLHGLFVYRAASLLRDGGRLGLVLPTSVADLDGYSATRSAHDALCEVDAELLDFGDGAFEGVFQPSMALLSTRRDAASRATRVTIWPLRNQELSALECALLERSRCWPRFPPEQFGERGFQTMRDDQEHLTRQPEPSPTFSVALREGADISEFRALSPRVFANAAALGTRLRPSADWQKVAVLIRQTARFPIAARADGVAFRNSILAGFESADCPAPLLIGLLNSTFMRWLHYSLHRDARQGMPQLKVGHLRALPALPQAAAVQRQALITLCTSVGAANRGISPASRAQLDELVASAFALSAEERESIERWAAAHPLPMSRREINELTSSPTGGPANTLEVAVPG